MKSKILLLVLSTSLISCSKSYVSHRSVNIQRKDLITNSLVADVSVDLQKKITAESGRKNNINLAMDDAYFNAITNNKIDILVDPVYNITTTPRILIFGGKAIATVTGFPGKYTSTKPIYEAVKQYNMDTSFAKNFALLNYASTRESTTPKAFEKPLDPKKKALGGAVATVGILLLLRSILGL